MSLTLTERGADTPHELKRPKLCTMRRLSLLSLAMHLPIGGLGQSCPCTDPGFPCVQVRPIYLASHLLPPKSPYPYGRARMSPCVRAVASVLRVTMCVGMRARACVERHVC